MKSIHALGLAAVSALILGTAFLAFTPPAGEESSAPQLSSFSSPSPVRDPQENFASPAAQALRMSATATVSDGSLAQPAAASSPSSPSETASLPISPRSTPEAIPATASTTPAPDLGLSNPQHSVSPISGDTVAARPAPVAPSLPIEAITLLVPSGVQVPAALADFPADLIPQQAAQLDTLTRDFTDAVNVPNRIPSNPNYVRAWQTAQWQSDQNFRAQFGWAAFNQQQLAAARLAGNPGQH